MTISNVCRSVGRKNRNCSREEPRIRRRNWEVKFGCYAALSLTALEVKRLLLLTLEMLLDSRAIRFAGALLPLIFSFVDVGLGFPAATAALYAIRKHQAQPCYPKIKRILRRVTLVLVVCVILNIVTIVLIVYYVSFPMDSLGKLFVSSMRLYPTKASYKLTIDELQLDLQCCGCLSYIDWFSLDWQGMDYVGGEDRYGGYERSVPFSCCSLRTMMPCIHIEMRKEDEKTVNNHGCVAILNRILYKIAVVGYTMTSLIICSQIIIIIFLIRIIRRVFPEICPDGCPCCEDRTPFMDSSTDECSSPCPKSRVQTLLEPRKFCRRLVIREADGTDTSPSRPSSPTANEGDCTTSWSSSDDSSSSSCVQLTSSPSTAPKLMESARIIPSAQLQHQLPTQQRKSRR